MYRLEVFKTGTHTAMNGVERTYTVEDLQKMATQYNEQKDHEAPLVIGHPDLNDPAYGWTKKFEVVKDRLYAYCDQVSEILKESVKAGMFKKVSLSIYPDGLIRHIGLLGAVPPAVKGLSPVHFNESDPEAEIFEYAWATDEYRVPIIGKMLTKFREFIIEKFGSEDADKVFPLDDIQTLLVSPNETYIKPEKESDYYKEDNTMDVKELETKFNQLSADFDKIKADKEEVSTQYAEAMKVIDTLKTAIETEKTESQKKIDELRQVGEAAAFSEFVEGLIREGKVLPAEKDNLVSEFSDLSKADTVMNYGEGEKSLVEKFRERLTTRPVTATPTKQYARQDNAAHSDLSGIPVEFAEFANEIILESVDQDKKIAEYAETHKCTYEDAVTALYGG